MPSAPRTGQTPHATGAVTRALIPQLSGGSRLDIVEANPRFAARLRHLVADHPHLAGRPGQVDVYQTYVENLDTDQRYDVIVSGLPLTNFTPPQVETIMYRYLNLLHPGGTLTYFAYLGTRTARALFASRDEGRRHAGVNAVMATYQATYAAGRRKVWANLPPAEVWNLHRPPTPWPNPGSTLFKAGPWAAAVPDGDCPHPRFSTGTGCGAGRESD